MATFRLFLLLDEVLLLDAIALLEQVLRILFGSLAIYSKLFLCLGWILGLIFLLYRKERQWKIKYLKRLENVCQH